MFRYLCEQERGREQEDSKRGEDGERRMIHSIHVIFFYFFLSVSEACVLDKRECVRGRVSKKMEKEGRA